MADDYIKPPNTEERGHPGGFAAGYNAKGARRYSVISAADLARELQFPQSAVIYDAMRVETQLSGVLEAIAQPVLNADWHLEGEGVPDNVVEFVRLELGLPTKDAPLSRTYHNGINIRDHIAEMVETMLWAGFACAEQVYDVGPATPMQEGLGAGYEGEVRHLRKLAPRPPRTITDIETERDGGLKGIRQTPLEYEGANIEDEFIGVENLVFYSHKRKGAAWQGESVLRPAYRPWALKDIYLRLDAQAVDKHSSGYWRGKTNDKNRADALFGQLAELRTGERGVIVTDEQDSVELIGLTGSLVDITSRLNYLDQQMSRSALAMFLDLGHDNGARSLGETHLKVFHTKVRAIAEYIGRTVTEHVIRDLVRHNYPDGTPYPELSPGDIIAQQGTSAENIGQLLRDGGLTYDRGIEDYLRGRYGIPALPDPEDEDAPEDDANGDLEREKAEAEILRIRSDAAGSAFRIGFKGEELATAYKLPPELVHSGFMPITIKSPDVAENEEELTEAQAQAATARLPGPAAVAASGQTSIQRATEAYNALMARVAERTGTRG